jgi:tRNA (uracil-5-)-methyltransferase TRM9
MDEATQLALNAINRRFYAAVAGEWSEKRNYAWPGFERVWSALPAASSGKTRRVLDLGCGDGRFAQFLEGRGELDYLGIDASEALLAHARARGLGASYRFQRADFVTLSPSAAGGRGPFELIAVFGVLHHIPSRERRRALVRELAGWLAPDGLLALTFWHYPEDPRFAARVIRFEDYNRQSSAPIALDQLEPGDTLLRWGRGTAPPRYCHFPNADEIMQLLAASDLQLRARFRADGRGEQLNEYALLGRASPM